MANPIALPGTNVPSGAAVSPGGAQGPSAVSANANNKATLGSDSLVLVQGTAAGVAATTHAQTVSGDDPQLTNTRTPTAHQASHVTGSDQIPLASASTKGLLNQTSGNTTDFIDGTNNSQALQPVIWSATRRVFNALSNPTFEVDQRNVGNAIVNPVGGTFVADRWFKGGGGTYQVITQTVAQALGGGSAVVLPGTNFRLSRQLLALTLSAQETSMAAGDFLVVRQTIEGSRFRGLSQDVHSVSILIQSSVAPLKFGLFLRDGPTVSRSLTKLCTYTGPVNTWQLITLPNLPVWPTAGNFGLLPGGQGYDFGLCFACGSTGMSPANDTWQNTTTNSIGAVGQDNWCANPVNSTILVGFLQHEPGALCTTPIDCPFTQNYDDCLRYYTKSYDLAQAVGGITTGNVRAFIATGAAVNAYGPLQFHKPMAKSIALTLYNHATGTANSVQDNGGVNHASATALYLGSSGFGGITFATATTAQMAVFAHYTADTVW